MSAHAQVPGGVEESASGVLLGGLIEWGLRAVQGRRPSMEDEHVIKEIEFQDLRPEWRDTTHRGAVICVFDGHAGKEASKMAAEHFVDKLLASSALAAGDVRTALTDAFSSTDRAILEESNEAGWKSGSTAVVCLVLRDDPEAPSPNHGDSEASTTQLASPVRERKTKGVERRAESDARRKPVLWVANAGDSEAVLGNRYNLTNSKRTVDDVFLPNVASLAHKPTDQTEMDRIAAAGGRVVRGRVFGMLGVARSLGDIDYKYPFNNGAADYVSAEPYVAKIPLLPAQEFLIVSCDGLWERFSYEQAVSMVAREKFQRVSAEEIALRLVRQGVELGSRDNVSAIVLFFSPKLVGASHSRSSKNRRSLRAGKEGLTDTVVSANPLFAGTKVGLYQSKSANSSPTSSPKKSLAGKTKKSHFWNRRKLDKADTNLGATTAGVVDGKGQHVFVTANPLRDQKLSSANAVRKSRDLDDQGKVGKQGHGSESSSSVALQEPTKVTSGELRSIITQSMELEHERKTELNLAIARLSKNDGEIADDDRQIVHSLVRFQAHARRRGAQRLLRERIQNERARRAALKVIAATVREYLEKMQLLIDVYLTPLKTHLAESAAGAGKRKTRVPIIAPDELTDIFPTPALEVIFDKSSRLLDSLRRSLSQSSGDLQSKKSSGNMFKASSVLGSDFSPVVSRKKHVDVQKSTVHGLTRLEEAMEDGGWDFLQESSSQNALVTPAVGGLFTEFSQYVSEYRRYISDYLSLSVPRLAFLRKSNAKFVAWEAAVEKGDIDAAKRALSFEGKTISTAAGPHSAEDIKRIEAAANSGWLDLDALLRRPVDHLPMLNQLVQQLCTATWEEHADSSPLNAALRELSSVERFISDVRALREATSRLIGKRIDRLGLEEAGHRFLFEGALSVATTHAKHGSIDCSVGIDHKHWKKTPGGITTSELELSYMFLFDNQLVITRVEDSWVPAGHVTHGDRKPQQCVVRSRVMLDKIASVSVSALSNEEFVITDSFGVQVLSGNAACTRNPSQMAEKWVSVIRTASVQYHRTVALTPARREGFQAGKMKNEAKHRSRAEAKNWREITAAAAMELGVRPGRSADSKDPKQSAKSRVGFTQTTKASGESGVKAATRPARSPSLSAAEGRSSPSMTESQESDPSSPSASPSTKSSGRRRRKVALAQRSKSMGILADPSVRDRKFDPPTVTFEDANSEGTSSQVLVPPSPKASSGREEGTSARIRETDPEASSSSSSFELVPIRVAVREPARGLMKIDVLPGDLVTILAEKVAQRLDASAKDVSLDFKGTFMPPNSVVGEHVKEGDEITCMLRPPPPPADSGSDSSFETDDSCMSSDYESLSSGSE